MCRLITYFERPSGEVPMREFAESLPESLRSKLDHDLDLMRNDEALFQSPKTAPVRDGIFELKTKVATTKLRAFFFYAPGGEVVITNGFVKKTRKTPSREISRALRYRSEYLSCVAGSS